MVRNLYETIENGNNDNQLALGLSNSNSFTKRIISVEPIYEYGPSGIPKNLKKYKLTVEHSNIDTYAVIVNGASINNVSGIFDINDNTLLSYNAINDIIDNINIMVNDLLLLKNQIDKTQNGVYIVVSLTPFLLQRDGVLFNNKKVIVRSDGILSNTYWNLLSIDPIIENTIEIIWDQISNKDLISSLININNYSIGQELLVSYKDKPTNNTELLPTYGLDFEDNLNNMRSDIHVRVLNIDSHLQYTYINVLSNQKLYAITGESYIIANFNNRNTNTLNKNYPRNLYVTNISTKVFGSPEIKKTDITLHFENTNANAISYIVAYRNINSSNIKWIYKNTKNTKIDLINLDYNTIYEIRTATIYSDTISIFSPKILIKTI